MNWRCPLLRGVCAYNQDCPQAEPCKKLVEKFPPRKESRKDVEAH